jgi:etoposide-induced 2.4 mRNA
VCNSVDIAQGYKLSSGVGYSVVNLLSLLLLSLFPVFFSPIFIKSPSIKNRAHNIEVWYDVLLSWPVFVLCFWINVSSIMGILIRLIVKLGKLGT